MAKVKLEDLKYVGLEKVEETIESAESVAEEVVEESAEVVEEEIKEEPAVEELKSANAVAAEPSGNNIINVYKLRIYSIPSTKVPARSFTGNVEVIGEVDKFKIVKYVRAGFGAVKGYTLDL